MIADKKYVKRFSKYVKRAFTGRQIVELENEPWNAAFSPRMDGECG